MKTVLKADVNFLLRDALLEILVNIFSVNLGFVGVYLVIVWYFVVLNVYLKLGTKLQWVKSI